MHWRRSSCSLARGLALAIVLSLGAGCGGSAGAPPATGGGTRAARGPSAWPEDQYIVAEGASTVSYAEAEASARNEVSARVRSELSAVIETEAGSLTVDGRTSDWQRLLSGSTVKTSFGHAEMIRPDPAARRLEKGVYHGLAALSRAEAAAALGRDYELAAGDFRAAVAQLQSGSDDIIAWTATLRRAESGFTRLATAAYALRAVTRREHAPFGGDLQLREGIEGRRAALLSGLRLRLVVEDAPEGLENLAANMGAALARLGLATAAGPCEPGAWLLRARPLLIWEQGPFGPVCRLTVAGQLEPCDGGRAAVVLNLQSKELVGTHTQGRPRALRELNERLTVERLLPLIRGELAILLPIVE